VIPFTDAITSEPIYVNSQYILRIKAAQSGTTNIILSVGGLITVVGAVDDIAALINTVLR
jgi:hypothetical protein